MVQRGVKFSDMTELGSEEAAMNRSSIAGWDDEVFSCPWGQRRISSTVKFSDAGNLEQASLNRKCLVTRTASSLQPDRCRAWPRDRESAAKEPRAAPLR